MTLETFVAQYGYPAVFIGAILEGETVLLIAAVLVQQGLMEFKGVVAVSAMGAFVGDQFFFLLGRCKGAAFVSRRPAWRKKFEKATALLDRRREMVVLFYRFVYGLRAIIPFLLGSGRCTVGKFALLSALSALAWAGLIGSGGLFLGETLRPIIDRGGSVQRLLIALASLIVAIIAALRWWRQRFPRADQDLAAKTSSSPPHR
jgi:membrane protein DedA with SNARE-associated domain